VQREALIKAGVPEGLIFAEKKSGTKREGREELARVLQIMRERDCLVVTRIDRLARSMLDFATILNDLRTRHIGFRCTEQAIIDTTSPTGELLLHILGAVAQFETQFRRERQMQGIAKPKANGGYQREPRVDKAKIRELLGSGMGPAAVARELKCSEMTVYRAQRGKLTGTPG
jgi:DNA invertase Pin-like site-specific DNA recombinase